MAEEGRALMTEREREIIAGEADDVNKNYEYKVRSLVRNRVRKQLEDDVDVLGDHFEEVHEMVTAIVCDDGTPNTDGGVSEDVDPEAARRAIDELEHALTDGDRSSIEDAIKRARDALEERDPDA